MSSPFRQLYREFATYYARERAHWVAEDPTRDAWAPRNPRRLFNLAVRGVFRAYRKRVSPAELVAAMYAVLGRGADGTGLPGRGTCPRPGLFRTFDPAKYRGRLPLASHFANLFKSRLWARLRKMSRPTTDNRRTDTDDKFEPRAGVGLFKQAWPCRPDARFDEVLETLGGQVFRLWDIRWLVATVPEALKCLDEGERAVVTLKYWDALSDRQIGLRLGVDHKTVRRRHDAAVAKLRGFYREEVAGVAA